MHKRELLLDYSICVRERERVRFFFSTSSFFRGASKHLSIFHMGDYCYDAERKKRGFNGRGEIGIRARVERRAAIARHQTMCETENFFIKLLKIVRKKIIIIAASSQ